MRINNKGQVTIPHKIRIQFGLFPDTEVEFDVNNGMIILKKTSGHQRAKDLLVQMSGKATVKMSSDEIMNLTR